jgi:diketogulonate reductase-like aldo/keto reductase
LEQKDFGNTGRKVSAIGMGTYYDPFWVATAFLGWRRGASKKVEAIRAGLDLGISLIDSAEIYGSEPLVAKAIAGRKREDLFIATKVWPNHLHRDDVLKSLARSLARLRVSYVDLYQIHWPNPRVPMQETMGAMEELIEQGKVLNVGVSNFSLEQVVEANAALKKSQIASVQLSYSLINRQPERSIIPYCEKEKIALMAYYPLGHGRLANDSRLAEFASKYSRTRAQIALNWLTSRRETFPIPRASSPSHVVENAAADGWRLEDTDLAKMDALFALK